MNILPIEKWGLFDFNRPFVIAGPCSAETESQVLETAKQLSEAGVKVFRAGIWKPRTRPGSFEGVGSVGLQWLKRVKEETGMLTSTEVANVKHVYEALKTGVDILWIGARTSANPFAVQEIADALKGVDIPVIVKNPVNPDIDLWYGAIERIYLSGINRVAGLHRGFSGIGKSNYRNEPLWQIPIDLRNRIENLSMICDPSHISGRRDLIYPVSQKAMDLNYTGLMIESHIDPDSALSDAKQQVTPERLSEILENLIIRKKTVDNSDFKNKIEELRTKIDGCDNAVFDMLETRMKIAAQIGKVKKENNVSVLQASRWKNIMTDALRKGNEAGLSDKFVKTFYKAVHQESINIQSEILSKKTE